MLAILNATAGSYVGNIGVPASTVVILGSSVHDCA